MDSETRTKPDPRRESLNGKACAKERFYNPLATDVFLKASGLRNGIAEEIRLAIGFSGGEEPARTGRPPGENGTAY